MLAGDVNRAASPKEIILNPHSEPAGVCVCVCVCVCVFYSSIRFLMKELS